MIQVTIGGILQKEGKTMLLYYRSIVRILAAVVQMLFVISILHCANEISTKKRIGTTWIRTKI
jgi:hypothetical protein